jgi:ABC-type sulfate/molybdate transport systems ATPase subunit
VLLLDEPTNHLDLEAIEALVGALDKYEGTLIFVSHDRWFVSKLATRVVEITPAGFRDFPGTYDEYLDRAGIDHVGGTAGAAPAAKRRSEAPPKPSARAVEEEAERGTRQRRVRRSGRTVERGTFGE